MTVHTVDFTMPTGEPLVCSVFSKVIKRGEAETVLSPTEKALLYVLLTAPALTASVEDLCAVLPISHRKNNLNVHLHRLRRSLKPLNLTIDNPIPTHRTLKELQDDHTTV